MAHEPELQRVDAVLPLTAADAERARLLFRSLDAFFEPLGTCYVVVPERDLSAVRDVVPANGFELLPETEVVPELRRVRRAARLRSAVRLVRPPLHGWFVQQLVKLAVAETVSTPFYLTLDSDVVCVRPTRYADLVRGGRAIVQTASPNHPEWNDDAERVLALPRSGRQHAVTPALLSRDAVAELARHLDRRGRRAESWRRFLLRNLPWTEYALYHTFLEQTGRFDAYHVLAGADAIYGECAWVADEVAAWDPARAARLGCPFSVVQSATRADPALLEEKFDRYLTAGVPTVDARPELERLRGEVETLRRRNAELELGAAAPPAGAAAHNLVRNASGTGG